MKRLSFVTRAGLLFFLTACGSLSGPQSVSVTTSDGLPVETQLALGTLKLEGTGQAVTADQADDLLVMWQVYQELNGSGTAAQAEIDGLLEQIQETMTADQMQAISGMNLTQQDAFAAMQTAGIALGGVQTDSSGTTQSGGNLAPPDGGLAGAGNPPAAGMAGAAPLDGGVDGMGPAEISLSTDQTQRARTSPGAAGSSSLPAALVEALIQYLQNAASA